MSSDPQKSRLLKYIKKVFKITSPVLIQTPLQIMDKSPDTATFFTKRRTVVSDYGDFKHEYDVLMVYAMIYTRGSCEKFKDSSYKEFPFGTLVLIELEDLHTIQPTPSEKEVIIKNGLEKIRELYY